MALQTATNPTTGERVVLVNNEWQPVTQSATNKQGVKAYLVGDKWLTDETVAPSAPNEIPTRNKSEATGSLFPSVQTIGNLAAGALRGAGSIGATLIRPFETAEENAARRRSMNDALATMGAEPESASFGVGKFAGELAGTAGVGGFLAAPVKAAARFAPSIATPIATALETGGLVAKVAGKPVSSTALRVGAGAATGAAGSTLINPEEASTGAVTGAGVALVAPPVVKKLAEGAGFLTDVLTGRMVAVKAGQISREVAGERIAAIRAALAAAPDDLTAAQATAGVQRNAFQALGAFAEKTDDVSMVLKQQAANDIAQLQRMAEGGNETEMRRAYEASVKRLNQLTADMRNVELQAANQANQTINRLAPLQQQRQASMVNALREGMPANLPSGVAGTPLPGVSGVHAGTEALQRANVAEDAARRLMVSRSRGARGVVSAGPVPGTDDLKIERANRFVSDQWQEASDVFANIAKQRRAESGFIERQIGSLESHGLRPLDTTPIVNAIETKLTTPGIRASSNAVKVLEAVRDDIANLTAKGGGTIDAHDLYTLRKEGINERIQQILGQTDPKVSAKVTRKMLGELRPMIDDAIEQAGGTGWRDYLKTYSQNMQAIDQKAMAAQAARLFKDSPQEYVRLVRGNNPDAVESIFGPGSYDIFKEMSDKMPTLEKLAKNIERDKEMIQAAGKGADEFRRILEKEGQSFPKFRNLLSRPVTIANITSDELEKLVSPKIAAKLQQGMVSGKSALEMLDTLPSSERIKVLKVLTNPNTWGAKGAIATRAVTTLSTPDIKTNNLSNQQNQNALAR